MLLPTTHFAVLVLLWVAVICLGSWASTFKLAGPSWRFELFYFDFAFGAVAAALVLAYTAGTLGSSLSFVDRLAVAGLREQAMAIGGGFLFSLGNMLLLGSISLIGMAAAFPLAFAFALVVWSLTSFHGVSYPLLGIGDVLLIGAVLTAVMSRQRQLRTQAAPAVPKRPPTQSAPMKKRTKGAIAGLVGGLFIGGSYPLATEGFWGDFGLGPYGGLLLFAVGVLISTLVFGLFFLNIAIDGPRLTLGAYFSGKFRSHLLGLFGGIIWTAGMAGWLLAQSAATGEEPLYPAVLWALGGSALVAMLWGALGWHEFRDRGARANVLIALTTALYAGGLAALSLRFH